MHSATTAKTNAAAKTAQSSAVLRRAKPLLGTLVDISVEAMDVGCAQRALADAFAEIATVHRLMSFHEPGSDLARLNRAAVGAQVEVDFRTAQVLHHAAAFTAESGGAFDVEVADVLIGFGLLPPTAQCAPSAATSGMPRNQAPPAAARCLVTRGPRRIDLGGIAKGYAVDRAIDMLVRLGVRSALVNAGGDLRHVGNASAEIHLRDPADPSQRAASITLANTALASSATSGLADASPARSSMLIDRRCSTPLALGAGVSIVAPTCLLADMLTKVVLVTGDTAHPMLQRHGGQVVLYRPAPAITSQGAE
jgi:thiamine biosynthesis lipoprotein